MSPGQPRLTPEVAAAVEKFVLSSGFQQRGGVITDLDGTAVHEERGRINIPPRVELGLRSIYEQGVHVVLNSLRFPLSVMRTFGKEWLTIAAAPIPVISLNGSQLGHVTTDSQGELCFDEISAFPLLPHEIDPVLAGIDVLLADGIRDILLFYYPRDWRLGEVIWTPVAEKVVHVKEKYGSASSVIAIEPEKLAEVLHSQDICMMFLLIDRPSDELMAYQHSKPSSFFTTKGVDKLSGTIEMGRVLDIDIDASLGAGDTMMDKFLNSIGLSVHVGFNDLPFRGVHNTIKLPSSFELGDLLFYTASLCGDNGNAKRTNSERN